MHVNSLESTAIFLIFTVLDTSEEDATINTLLESANRTLLEKLNAFSRMVSDINLFVNMHVIKEAPTLSWIDGT